jgi:hypothetical protein
MARCSHLNLLNTGRTDYSDTGFTIVTGTLWIYRKGETSAQFKSYLAQQYANGTPVTVYYQLTLPVVTTLTKTALPTYKPTTVIESESTVKGNVIADYKLKANATPVAGDFIASPECVNDIKDLGNSIDVVSSVGRRNLLRNSGAEYSSANEYVSINITDIAKANLGKKFYLSFELKSQIAGTIAIYSLGRYGINGNISINASTEYQKFSQLREFTYGSVPDPNGENCLLSFYGTYNTGKKPTVRNLKIEIAEDESVYTPAPEDILYNEMTEGVYKSNILLGAPLRSVGAVKDRLFKDSDGKWKIERNIGKRIVGADSLGLNWNASYLNQRGYKIAYFSSGSFLEGLPKPYNYGGRIESNMFQQMPTGLSVYTELPKYNISTEGIFSSMWFCIPDEALGLNNLDTNWNGIVKPAITKFFTDKYDAGKPVTINYILNTPTYETLSQELQTKLDNIPTFPEHNYVYTVTNDNLQPTLHVDYKKLSWLRSRLLVNSLKIYSRNLTDAEMVQNYKVEKERFGM